MKKGLINSKLFVLCMLFIFISSSMVSAFNWYPEITFNVVEQNVETGDTIHIAVSATDNEGISKISYQQGTGTWNDYSCNGATSCSHTFTITENTAGVYTFRGRVIDTIGHIVVSDYDSVMVHIVACNSNTECGTDGFVGATSCSSNDVYQTYRTYTCSNPGTYNSQCSNTDTLTLEQDCAYTCSAGACSGECNNGATQTCSLQQGVCAS